MLDAKELADLLYAELTPHGLKKDNIDLQAQSDALFLKAMFSRKVLSRIWIDAMCDATSEQENKLFEDFNQVMDDIASFKLIGGESWAMTLSNSITLAQARIGRLVIMLIKQACENHVKAEGEDLLTDALAYVHDMENENDYP